MIKLLQHIKSIDRGNSTLVHIHKVMYYTLGNYMKDNGITELCKDLYTSPMVAWDMGAISKELYQLECLGTITPHYYDSLSSLDEYIVKYLNEDEYNLVDLELNSNTKWNNNQEIIQDRTKQLEYSLKDIHRDFKEIELNMYRK